MCRSVAGAVSLAEVGEEAVFTSLPRKMLQLSPVKWGEHEQQHFLLAPARMCDLLTVLAQS